jgi:hypothetical protein
MGIEGEGEYVRENQPVEECGREEADSSARWERKLGSMGVDSVELGFGQILIQIHMERCVKYTIS